MCTLHSPLFCGHEVPSFKTTRHLYSLVYGNSFTRRTGNRTKNHEKRPDKRSEHTVTIDPSTVRARCIFCCEKYPSLPTPRLASPLLPLPHQDLYINRPALLSRRVSCSIQSPRIQWLIGQRRFVQQWLKGYLRFGNKNYAHYTILTWASTCSGFSSKRTMTNNILTTGKALQLL